MKKRITFSLLILLAWSVVTGISQQQPGTEKLEQAAAEQDRLWHEQRAIAEALARQAGYPIRADLSDGRVMELQRFEDNLPVYYTTFNLDAARTISTDRVWPGGGFALTGSGITLGLWDGGRVRKEHQELGTSRVTQTDNITDNDHSTHVAGTLIASGVDPQAKGMAPLASLEAHDFNNDYAEMMTSAGLGLHVSNHSYGVFCGWYYGSINGGPTMWHWFGNPSVSHVRDYHFGFYTIAESKMEDDIAANYPNYLSVWAAGNDRNEGPPTQPLTHTHSGIGTFTDVHASDGGAGGYDILSPTAVAKNIITVGAVTDITNGYTKPSVVDMTWFSSWGPTDDGRIKPDLVADGLALYSSSSKSNSAYEKMSGTSMSTATVTGSIGLLLQHQENLNGSKSLLSSTIKALLIHTADEAGDNPGPDYSFGWGLMNTARAAEVMTLDYANGGNVYIHETTLNQGSTIDIPVYANGSEPLRVTICWIDPSGTPSAPALNPTKLMLVNDLDLRILKASQTFYPWTLNPARPKDAATTGDNIRDNVEQVHIESPEAGTYTVRIQHKGILSGGQQKVSVIITGGFSTLTPTCADWTRRHNNGAANGIEDMGFKIPTDAKTMAHNLAVDAIGNVYVTGYSFNATTGYDYHTIKYGPLGDQLWIKTYSNGNAAGSDDKAYALAIDHTGNVYVTGESKSTTGTGVDIATIKYDTSGNEVWQMRYTGPGGKYDAGYAIIVSFDDSKVYVAGETNNGTTTGKDFVTVAYNTATGAEAWASPAFYNGPGNGTDRAYAIALDQVGNVVVTGESKGTSETKIDYATIKYDAATGTALWPSAARFDGSAHKNDFPFAIAVNSSGEIYVTGGSEGGQATSIDYATVKYTSDGIPAGAPWPVIYNNSSVNKKDVAYAMALDASGNVYVTGASQSANPVTQKKNGYDYTTIKYSSAGLQQWINSYEGGVRMDDIARSIAVNDAEQAVFVTGSSFQKAKHGQDYVTLRLPMAGSGIISPDWVGKYNGAASKNDVAYSIAVKPGTGCIVVAGTSEGQTTGLDFATIIGPSNAPLPTAGSPAVTFAEDNETATPVNIPEFKLYDNYPNPFNPTTTIQFSLPHESYVTLKVFNILGQEVATLFNHEWLSDGVQEVDLNANNLSSGVYFYQIIAEELQTSNEETPRQLHVSTKKMVLMK